MVVFWKGGTGLVTGKAEGVFPKEWSLQAKGGREGNACCRWKSGDGGNRE